MKDDVESRLKEFYELYKACEVIGNWIQDNWEPIKEMARAFMQWLDYEYEPTTPKQIYGYVKHKVMKSQVIDRKPKCIRARTVC
ncbi:hypothetical protein CBR56_27400 [Bacillus thuringiensis]|uniref:hypothetical protein n=1 Tax=Bacillus cereus group TaxID=86661 RepID=UPI000B431678|nr:MULTISPECIES: hypothetical protein [Bacillus cereus group]OTX80671.1 hypothetical protein BK728_18365 [Bacillus thuringiensis serovar chanpaisis]MED3036648.1 hypothetical protein [Bacillus tropicus]PNK22371.1 hypothetical protein CBP87_31565 [Bacillus thuringiensis]PNK23196.1 hypothetical protein CBR56_27400 [Bacillus thuringiensis]PNK24290.1 hypothetical protein CBR55_32485 [Bacillus thuringiensis]